MDKLQMCRICLAENVHMYVVVNDTLHDLYEKLTDNSFVTEDSRPILACFICCAQLKKCYRLMKKCLEAEEQFGKMMNEEYERKPLINQDHFEFFHGFIRSPIEIISIVDVDQTESIVVKEELPAVCERLNDIIETKEEHESDDEYAPQRHLESHSEDDVPLMDVKIKAEYEQDESKRKRKCNKNNKTPLVVKKTNDQKPTGEKPHKCVKCNLYFKGKRGLTTHVRNHTDEIFQCQVCQRKFSQKGHLYQHIRKYNSFESKAHRNSHNLINPDDFFSEK